MLIYLSKINILLQQIFTDSIPNFLAAGSSFRTKSFTRFEWNFLNNSNIVRESNVNSFLPSDRCQKKQGILIAKGNIFSH